MVRSRIWVKTPLRNCVPSVALLAVLLTGCPSKSDREKSERVIMLADLPLETNAPNLDELIPRTSKSGQAILVLVADLGLAPADGEARTAFEAVKAQNDDVVRVLLDISASRNRAEATRFHIMETPVLFCLSSKGVIVSRDEKPITQELVRKRMSEIVPLSRELDTQLDALEKPVAANSGDATAQLALTDFLLAQQNAREAIPHLETVAHSESSETAPRVRAWVDLARAHLWIAEPEKARHEAKDLMDALGPAVPEALAGGKLVLGTQDTNGKRFKLAREEFEAAIAAAPDSAYAKQAGEALAKLPPPVDGK